MGFVPFSYWGNNSGTIVPNGIVFYHTPTSFTGVGTWLDVSGNNNHAYVSGAAMGNDSTGWMFNGGQFSTGSNSLVWPSTLVNTPSSSFTLQWYGNFYVEGAPNYNARYFWRTTNELQDLSGSGWTTNYVIDYIDALTYSGSTYISGGSMYLPTNTYFNGTTASLFTLTSDGTTQKLYINDNPIAVAIQSASIFDFTGSTSGEKYPLTFGKAPLHVRADGWGGNNALGKSTVWGYLDENHNYQEGTSGYGAPFGAWTWPSTAFYKVSGDAGSTTNNINNGPLITSSLLEPLINQNPYGYGIGVSGSVNSLLLYNRVLSPGEIINNARVITMQPALIPNVLPTPQPPTAVTQSATNLSLFLDAKNGYWYNQSVWRDISGNTNDFNLVGACTYDPITGSVGFYGSPADYFVNSKATVGLNLSTSASVEVWLKWWGGEDLSYYRYAFAMGKSSAGAFSGSYAAVLYGDNGYTKGLEGRWGPATNPNYIPAYDATHNYTKTNSNNIWRQCVLVKTGDTLDYYVNGALENTRTGFASNIISGSTLMVGGWHPGGASSGSFVGEVAIVKVWNGTSLSSTDISASFAANKSRFGL